MKMKTKKLIWRQYYWTIPATVLLALLAGYGFTESEDPTTPAVIREAPEPLAQPVNFGPVINTKLRQAEPSFTADGKTMYFNCQVRSDRAGNDICVSRLIGTLEDGKWPEVVAPGVINLKETFDYAVRLGNAVHMKHGGPRRFLLGCRFTGNSRAYF
jgi:hypothetical protein